MNVVNLICNSFISFIIKSFEMISFIQINIHYSWSCLSLIPVEMTKKIMKSFITNLLK